MTTTLAESGLGSKKFKRLNLLLYGPPGSWKTVAAHNLPRTRTLDFDEGMQSVEWAIRAGEIERELSDVVFETIKPPPTMDEAKNDVYDRAVDTVYEWLKDEEIKPEEWNRPYPQMWDTLIIDSGTSLTAATTIKALRENARLGLSESWSKRDPKGLGLMPTMIQDFGATGKMFEKFLTFCFSTGKNIVLICHEYNNVDKKGNLLSIDPALVGQLRQSVPKDFDEVWYSKVTGTKQKPKGIFQTQRDPLRRCKSRLGCLDADQEADFRKIKAKVAKFYQVGEEQIWTAAHGTEGARKMLEEEAKADVAI